MRVATTLNNRLAKIDDTVAKARFGAALWLSGSRYPHFEHAGSCFDFDSQEKQFQVESTSRFKLDTLSEVLFMYPDSIPLAECDLTSCYKHAGNESAAREPRTNASR